ncbi:MAG: leucine-rich repeat protein [Paludibacteraceae bacterium]|nr:leucine-rich repeat protein [Paludibacteraceae bacterium]
MKKIFMAIAAMTMLIATSCKESANAPEDLVPGDGEFLVTIANAPRQEAPTNGKTVKTTIVGSDIIWSEGDLISINGVTYRTNTSGSPVIFSSASGDPAIVDGDSKYKAYYPVEIAPTNTGCLPETIQYNGGNLKNLPMYAESENNVLTFHNICAALKITVPNLDEGVTCDKIVISANENLAGKFSIETDENGVPRAVLSTTAENMSKTVTVTPENENDTFTGEVYVALPAGTYTYFAVEFWDGDDLVMRRMLAERTFEVNNLYNIAFGEFPADMFCFIAKESGCTVTLKSYNTPPTCTFEYYDATMQSWSPYTPGTDITLTNVGDRVYFKAGTNGNDKLATGQSYYYYFSSDKKVAVSGNVMYLLNQNGLPNLTTDNNNAFCSLFYGMKHLEDASGLILPATNLATGCYSYMFKGCKALTAAPSLPATNLANNCYVSMFEGCEALTAAPSLPATTLAMSCYSSMFRDCSTLTAAPSLPATILANNCYDGMFRGCTSLETAPSLPAETLATECYWNMFRDCTSLTTAPSLPATTLADKCYNSMFYNCSTLTAAPDLPAETLATSCYQYMFQKCSALTAAPDLLATTLADYCYKSMFESCSSLGVGRGTVPSGAKTLVVPNFTGAEPSQWGDDMFMYTGGDYTGNPRANTTYYFYDATQH